MPCSSRTPMRLRNFSVSVFNCWTKRGRRCELQLKILPKWCKWFKIKSNARWRHQMARHQVSISDTLHQYSLKILNTTKFYPSKMTMSDIPEPVWSMDKTFGEGRASFINSCFSIMVSITIGKYWTDSCVVRFEQTFQRHFWLRKTALDIYYMNRSWF